MAKRAVNKTKARKNFIHIIICFLIVGGFLYTLVNQQLRLISIRREMARCEQETAVKQEEYERLKKKEEYYSSDKYREEKVRDEGYVRDDEIVFVVGN